MKHLISISIIIVLLAGCRSTKKLVESSAVVSNQTEVVTKFDTKEEVVVNNDKTSYKRTTITETNYGNRNKTRIKPSDEVIQDIKVSEPINDDNVVKSVKVTVIEEGLTDKTKVETVKTDNSEVATKTEDKSKVENSTVEKKSVPIPWGWIFGCLTLLTGGLLYIAKPKFMTVFFTFIKKLFA